MVILAIACLLPAWVVLSMPNVWFKSQVKIPAKRLTILTMVISVGFAFIVNLELEMGMITMCFYLVVSTLILSVLFLPISYFYLKARTANGNI